MIKEPCLNYGEKIQELRVQMGLTLQELAFITETNEMTIRNLEKSFVHPTNHFIEKVANALNVNPFELKTVIWCEQELEKC